MPESKASETSPSAKRAVLMWRGMQKGKAGTQGQAGVDGGEARRRVGPGRHPDDAGARRPDREAPGARGRGKDGTLTLPDGERSRSPTCARCSGRPTATPRATCCATTRASRRGCCRSIAERPLVMKRFPNGVNGKAFYQQRAPDVVPPGVRVEDGRRRGRRPIAAAGRRRCSDAALHRAARRRSRRTRGSRGTDRRTPPTTSRSISIRCPACRSRRCATSRAGSATSSNALDVPGVLKTSGSSGLHVYIPLPEGTSYEVGPAAVPDPRDDRRAQASARSRPSSAPSASAGAPSTSTTCRTSRARRWRPRTSPRASEFGGVSTPLTWDELDEGVSPGDFTIKTAPARFAAMPDLWRPVIAGPPVDLHGVLERMARDPARYARSRRSAAGAAGAGVGQPPNVSAPPERVGRVIGPEHGEALGHGPCARRSRASGSPPPDRRRSAAPSR